MKVAIDTNLLVASMFNKESASARLLDGIMEIILAFRFRPLKFWAWLLVSGVIAVTLSVLILSGWPQLTIAFLGVFIGLNFLLHGISLLFLIAVIKKQA